jgi:hypothetical protein
MGTIVDWPKLEEVETREDAFEHSKKLLEAVRRVLLIGYVFAVFTVVGIIPGVILFLVPARKIKKALNTYEKID